MICHKHTPTYICIAIMPHLVSTLRRRVGILWSVRAATRQGSTRCSETSRRFSKASNIVLRECVDCRDSENQGERVLKYAMSLPVLLPKSPSLEPVCPAEIVATPPARFFGRQIMYSTWFAIGHSPRISSRRVVRVE